MINVRNFSSFNQILGFNQGNLLLKKIADQLASFCKEPNKLYKLYSDKFVITMHTEDMNLILKTANDIHAIYQKEPIMNFRLELGIGITQYFICKRHDNSASEILGALEIACMRSSDFENHLYVLPIEKYLAEKTNYNLEYHLREAIENRVIEVYYQPQVSSATREIISFEALA